MEVIIEILGFILLNSGGVFILFFGLFILIQIHYQIIFKHRFTIRVWTRMLFFSLWLIITGIGLLDIYWKFGFWSFFGL